MICGASLGFFLSDSTAETAYFGRQGAVAPYEDRPVREGLFYDMASLTKVMGTSARILQLLGDERLRPDTRLADVLPAFAWPEITVSHLMFHDSGFPAEIREKGSWTKETILDQLYGTCPVWRPGERFVYSDVGFLWLGKLIEELDQMTLEESFQTHLFGPCGMPHTTFFPKRLQAECVPTECTKERGCICGEVHDRKGWLLGPCGSAGLFSTLEDVLRLVELYLAESERLFPKAWFERLKNEERKGRTWGWSREYGPGTLYHTGFTGTSILIDFCRGCGMVLLTNRIHPTRENAAFLEYRKEINRIFLGN